MISLLFPSRGRPEKCFQTAREWVKAVDGKVEFIFSFDTDDPLLYKYKELYKEFLVFLYNFWVIELREDCKSSKILIKPNESLVEATNKAAKASTGDILLYLSDDFKCPESWDTLIENEFILDDGPCLIKVDDCFQEFDVRVLTIPIMNRSLYKILGYFWYPAYKSMWVDCDLYETLVNLQLIKMCPYLKFPHEHKKEGNDEIYNRSEANWKQGEGVFNIRKEEEFKI